MLQSKTIKYKISILFILCVLLGMLLIDFAIIVMLQGDLIDKEKEKGYLFLSFMENSFHSGLMENRKMALWEKNFQKTSFEHSLVIDRSGEIVFSGGSASDNRVFLKQCIMDCLTDNQKKTRFFGSATGVFWMQKKYMVLAMPFFDENISPAGAGVLIDLGDIYEIIRNRHTILMAYIFANTIILTILALHRLSKIVINPLQRLVNRAEKYKEEDGALFFLEAGGNEFFRLSNSLNLMLKRISKDKIQLRQNIKSLERKNIQLKNAQREIIKAEKLASVGRLAFGLAHEIGNPISIVLGYLDLMKRKDVSPEERNDFVNRAEEEIGRIKNIIRQLLDFSRSSAENSESVSLHKLIKDILGVMRCQPLMENIEFSSVLNAQEDEITADLEQVRQVIINLIINAADAILSQDNRGSGKITITSNLTEIHDDPNCKIRAIRIDITDNGPGISQDQLENIYDPFFTTKEPGKGTGLGLSISFSIMENLGGKITASSIEGEGTTMSLLFPLKKT